MPTLASRTGERTEVLRDLVRSSTPSTSVYLRGARPEAGSRDLMLRWAALRPLLEEHGAPTADIAAVTLAVTHLPVGDRGLAAIVADGALLVNAQLDDYDGEDVAVYGPWPRVLPLLRWQQQRVPTVVAVVGHGQAHAVGYDDCGRPALTDLVVGADDEIERNAPGGWSQSRYRRRAEDSWTHNAAQFAVHVGRLAAGVHARLLVLAGDAREVALVLDRLPVALRRLATTDVAARPAHDGSIDVPADALRAAVRAAAARERLAKLAELDEAVGQRLAVEGPQDVRRVLDAGSVRRLIVVAGVANDQLADALVSAALDADSDVTVADPDDITLVGGVAALLRF